MSQFVEACKGGKTAVQTLHPGIYFHLASEYSISRSKLVDSLCSMVTTYSCPDPLQGMATRDKHSQTILDMLNLATKQFKLFNCFRMMAKLTLQMAEEKMVMMVYKGALDTLLPCLPICRQEKWPILLFNLLSTSFKCSFLSCNLSTYFSICLELCGLPKEASPWLGEEQRRIW